MKYLLLLTGFFSFCRLAGQEKRKVLDKVTGTPVSYVTIKVLHSERGVIGSADGEFTITTEPGDSILFTCAGYKPIIVPGNKIGDTVYMVRIMIELKPGVIGTERPTGTITIGNEEKIVKGDITWGPSPSGSYDEFAQKMVLPDSAARFKIKKVLIPVKKLRCTGSLLLRVYYPDSSADQPGLQVLNKLVHGAGLDVNKGISTIDVDGDNLFFYGADSFFISITWPPEAFREKCLTGIMLSGHSESQTYSRTLTISSFQWFSFVGRFKDKNGNNFEPRTFFAVEAEMYR